MGRTKEKLAITGEREWKGEEEEGRKRKSK